MQLNEVIARQKLACPACGGEAQWNPAKQSLVCAYCGTESPYELKAGGEIVEHDLVAALQAIPQSARGWQDQRRPVRCQHCQAISTFTAAQQGKALSLVFLGMSLSYVIGLPQGAWVGLQFGWRVPLYGLAALCGLMALLVGWLLPAKTTAPGASFAGLGELLRRPEVLRVLGLTLGYFSAIFTVFSYIGPVLQALNPMDANTLSLTLMLFGLAGVGGTVTGGWATDRFGPVRTLRTQLAVLTLMMLLVPLTRGSYPLMMAAFMVWGLSGFGMMSPTQARLAAAAPRQAPILFSFNSSMLYAGTALGAAVGGIASASWGHGDLPWVGAGFAVLASLSFVGAGRRR